MIKLKSLLPEWISHGIAVNRNPDVALRPIPGGMNDGSPNWNGGVEDWDGIVKGSKNEWFAHIGGNNWDKKQSYTEIIINEDEKPYKMWIKIKTHGLRKNNDTNESYKERVRKHTNKVARSWMSAAKDIHNNPDINEVGNPVPITWKHAFKEALNNPKVKSYLAEVGEQEIAPIVDPMNFTPRI